MSCRASLHEKPTRKETHSAKVCSLSLKKIFIQSTNQPTSQPNNKPTIRCIQNMHASRLNIPKKIELVLPFPLPIMRVRPTTSSKKRLCNRNPGISIQPTRLTRTIKWNTSYFPTQVSKKKKPGKETAKHMDFQCSVPGGSGAGKAVRLYSCQI